MTKLLFGGKLVQPVLGFVSSAFGFKQIDSVISSSEAHNTFARSQELDRVVVAATNSVPFAVTVKNTAPSLKAHCNEILIIIAQIPPKEAGAFENINFRHVEISGLCGVSLGMSFLDIST